jgi:hypothetical protein
MTCPGCHKPFSRPPAPERAPFDEFCDGCLDRMSDIPGVFERELPRNAGGWIVLHAEPLTMRDIAPSTAGKLGYTAGTIESGRRRERLQSRLAAVDWEALGFAAVVVGAYAFIGRVIYLAWGNYFAG